MTGTFALQASKRCFGTEPGHEIQDINLRQLEAAMTFKSDFATLKSFAQRPGSYVSMGEGQQHHLDTLRRSLYVLNLLSAHGRGPKGWTRGKSVYQAGSVLIFVYE